MDRRFGGAVMMALILVAVLCAPGVVGRSLGGTALPAVKVNPRPVAGSCLAPLETPDQLNTVLDLVPAVPCTQPHSAEVLAVGTLDPTSWPKRPTVDDPLFTHGSLSQHCDELAGQFLAWGVKNPLPRIPVSFYTKLTVPGDLQWQVGQRWYTCELLPGVLDFPISYTGTARNASIGTPPGAFANCSDEPGDVPVSCDRPHHAEQLVRSFSLGDVATGAAGEPCRQLVGKIIGTPDPTFGGQLAVLARSIGGAVGCWVTTTSSKNLTATLINHGAGPLPLQ